jgi:hypothetical protein
MKKTLFSVALAAVVLFVLATTAVSDSKISNSPNFADYPLVADSDFYPEDYIGYVYPLRPGMIGWIEIESGEDMALACQIPETILENMNTEALIQTVLSYPLIADVFMYETSELGFDAMRSIFNGLDELYNREDAVSSLLSVWNSEIESCGASNFYSTLYRNLRTDILSELIAQPAFSMV